MTISGTVEQFGDLLHKGYEYLTKACQLYVKAIDEDQEAKAAFVDAYPDIPATAWRRFEAVGRGSMHPMLLANLTVGARRLERCSYSEQAKYVKGPVEILLANKDVLKVSLHNLTSDQVRQVFATDHIRSIPEQRAYLESMKTRDAVAEAAAVEAKRNPAKSWRIVRGRLVVTGPCEFDKEDLFRVLIDMEKK